MALNVDQYYDEITRTLQGQTPALRAIPTDRLDWSGSGAVLELYDKTSGTDRENVIRAIGVIIDKATEPPSVIAQVIHIASSLNLAQLEPSVLRLRTTSLASVEPVRTALTNYFAYRQLSAISLKLP